MTVAERKAQIRQLAEDKAVELIRGGLTSPDPQLNAICTKLSAFQPLLNGKDVDEGKARDLLKTGFGMVRFKPDPGSPDEAEVLRLLEGLADKLSGMGSMLLTFLK